MSSLLIVGAGQYGMMVKELIGAQKQYDKIVFLDDNNPIAIDKIGNYENYVDEYKYVIVAIGNAEIRLEITDKLKAVGYEIVTYISPNSYVSPSAEIAEGCIIEPMSAVNTDAQIGRCTIISSGAVVNHNSTVGEGCHINCNATVCSNSNVPPKTKVDYGENF